MASDNEACCESDPNFAVICGFLEKFGVTCGLANIDFLDLQDMLENSQEVPQELVDLHVKLLRKARKSVSSERWERAIIKLCHGFCSQDAWEIERFGYKKARLSSKLRILKELLEMQFDYNVKFKNEINKLSAEELRTQPLGKDRLGHIYWFQSDNSCQIRVYKEDPDEETWSLVAKDREGLVGLITQLGDGTQTVVNEDSNSLESEKPVVDTGQTDSNSNSNSSKLDQVTTDTSNEATQVEVNTKEEMEGEKPDINEESNAPTSVEILKPTKIRLRGKKVILNEDSNQTAEINNGTKESESNGNNIAEQECKSENNIDKDDKEKSLSSSSSKGGISIRIKPISELISPPSSVEVNKKVEITGVKEKYIRSDSTASSSVHHRKAVDSAGFDVHTNFLKRHIDEEEDVEEPSYMKRPRVDRPTLLKRKIPSSDEEEGDEDEEVTDEVQEPLMLIRGEGSGQDNEDSNCQKETCSTGEDSPIVGEAVEEPIMYFYGIGMGHECETGNDNSSDKKDVSAQDQNTTQSKADADSTSDLSKSEANKVEIIDSIKDSESSNSFGEAGCSIKLSTKPEFKLGTIVDIRTNNLNPCVKNLAKKSRWDIGKPEEVAAVESQINDVNKSLGGDIGATKEKSNNLFEKDVDANIQIMCNKSDTVKSSNSDNASGNLPSTSKGKVQQLVSKWEKFSASHTNEEIQNPETIEEIEATASNDASLTVTPKKTMFFFGPGCLQVKPTISPLKGNISTELCEKDSTEDEHTSNISTELCEEDSAEDQHITTSQTTNESDLEKVKELCNNMELSCSERNITPKTANNGSSKTEEVKCTESTGNQQTNVFTNTSVKDNEFNNLLKQNVCTKGIKIIDSEKYISDTSKQAKDGETSHMGNNDIKDSLENSLEIAADKNVMATSKLLPVENIQTSSSNKLLTNLDSENKLEIKRKAEDIQLRTQIAQDGNMAAVDVTLCKEQEQVKVKSDAVNVSEKPPAQVEKGLLDDTKECLEASLPGTNLNLADKISKATSDIFKIPGEVVDKEASIKCEATSIKELTAEVLNTGETKTKDKVCISSSNSRVPANHHVPKSNISVSETKNDSSNDNESVDKSSIKVSEVPVNEPHTSVSSLIIETEKSKEVVGLPVIEKHTESLNTSVIEDKPKSKLENVLEKINQVKLTQKTDNIDVNIESKQNLLPDTQSKAKPHRVISEDKICPKEADVVTTDKVNLDSADDTKTMVLLNKSSNNVLHSVDIKSSINVKDAQTVSDSCSTKNSGVENESSSDETIDVIAITIGKVLERPLVALASTNLQVKTKIESNAEVTSTDKLANEKNVCNSNKSVVEAQTTNLRADASVEVFVKPEARKKTPTKESKSKIVNQLSNKLDIASSACIQKIQKAEDKLEDISSVEKEMKVVHTELELNKLQNIETIIAHKEISGNEKGQDLDEVQTLPHSKISSVDKSFKKECKAHVAEKNADISSISKTPDVISNAEKSRLSKSRNQIISLTDMLSTSMKVPETVSKSKTINQQHSNSSSKNTTALDDKSDIVVKSSIVKDTTVKSSVAKDTKEKSSVKDTKEKSFVVKDTKEKSSVVKDTKEKSSVVKDTTVKSSVAKDTMVKSSVVEGTKEKSSVKDTTVKSSVAKDSKEKSSVVKDTTVKSSVAKDTMVKSSVVEDTKEKSSVVKDTKEKSSVAKDTKEKSSVVEDTKEKSSVVKDTKVKSSVAKDTKEKSSVVKDTKEKSCVVKDTTVKSSVAKDTMVKSSVVEDTKEKSSVVKDTTVKSSVAKDTMVKSSVVEDTKEKSSVKNTTVKSSVAKDSKETSSVVKDTTVKSPVAKDTKETSSVVKDTKEKSSVVKDITVKSSVAKDTMVKSSVVEDTKEKSSVKDTTAKSSVVKDTMVKSPVVKDTKEKSSVVKDTTVKSSVVKDTTAKSSVVKDTTLKSSVVKDTVVKSSVVKDTVVKFSVVKDPTVKSSVVKDTIVNKSDIVVAESTSSVSITNENSDDIKTATLAKDEQNTGTKSSVKDTPVVIKKSVDIDTTINVDVTETVEQSVKVTDKPVDTTIEKSIPLTKSDKHQNLPEEVSKTCVENISIKEQNVPSENLIKNPITKPISKNVTENIQASLVEERVPSRRITRRTRSSTMDRPPDLNVVKKDAASESKASVSLNQTEEAKLKNKIPQVCIKKIDHVNLNSEQKNEKSVENIDSNLCVAKSTETVMETRKRGKTAEKSQNLEETEVKKELRSRGRPSAQSKKNKSAVEETVEQEVTENNSGKSVTSSRELRERKVSDKNKPPENEKKPKGKQALRGKLPAKTIGKEGVGKQKVKSNDNLLKINEDRTVTRTRSMMAKDKEIASKAETGKENVDKIENTSENSNVHLVDIEEQIVRTEIRPSKKLKLSDSVEVTVVDKNKRVVTTHTIGKNKKHEKTLHEEDADDKKEEKVLDKKETTKEEKVLDKKEGTKEEKVLDKKGTTKEEKVLDKKETTKEEKVLDKKETTKEEKVLDEKETTKEEKIVDILEKSDQVEGDVKDQNLAASDSKNQNNEKSLINKSEPEITDNVEELKPVDEPKCIQKKVALLTCVDINKLKAPSDSKPESSQDTEDANERAVDMSSDSDVSCGIGADGDSSDGIVIIPESDPLACSDEDSKNSEPVMTLATFKLDVDESTPAPSIRITRKRAAQQSIDALREKKTETENKDNADHKRPKLKQKRSVDRNLRRSIEEKKAKEISSSEDDAARAQQLVKEDGGKKSKSIAKRRISTRSTRATESPAPSSDAPSEASRTDTSNTPPVTKQRKPRKMKKTLLGLEIAQTEMIIKEESGVRQSRRIAQIKIKEEAERRKLEEVTLHELKEEQRKRKGKKDEDKDYKQEKRKRNKNLPTEDETTGDAESDEKKKRKRKRKHRDPRKQFDVSNPWKSSSGSSSSEIEEEEEEIEDEDDHQLVFRSDHEFSPESDMEEGGEIQPLKRARTARKESDPEEEVDDCSCQKCGQKDHPEWILLCDSCDRGWHCSCLRPALLVIPEGDWFCPPCQHATLVKNLETQLLEYDKKVNKRVMETRRKERLAYVGISLDNVLPSKESDEYRNKQRHHHSEEDNRGNESDVSGSDESGSDSDSSSSSDSDSEPIYQLRERRQAHSYRFNDYDELINSAIQDEIEAVKGAGNQGRGKDISTIVNAEKEEEAQRLKNEAEATDIVGTDGPPPDDTPSTTEVGEQEPLPPVVPIDYDKKNDVESDDEPIRPVRRIIGKKKHRKLNSLDVSSGDDAESDEDFKGSSSSGSEEDFDDDEGSDSSDADNRRRKRKDFGPIRRSTRARISRYDKDFINDDTDSENDAPRRKKTRSVWDESESEESDRSWGRRKRKSGKSKRKPSGKPKKSKKKKKKRGGDDSDPEVYRKRPNIKFGGLNDEEDVGRRTRGKKINYLEALGTDSEEEIRRKPPRIEESEEEYMLHEDEDFQQHQLQQNDKDSDESGVENVLKDLPIMTQPRPKPRGRGKAGLKIPRKPKEPSAADLFPPIMPDVPQPPNFEASIMPVESTIMQQQQQPLGIQQLLLESPIVQDQELQDIEDEPNPIEQINKNIEQMNEQEMEKMMEEEDYANKQLQLVALQIEKEKKRKEREAKRLENFAEKEQKIPKKRGRKPKNQMLGIPTDLVPPFSESSMLMNSTMANNAELSEPPGVNLPMFSEIAPALNADGTPKKRRGRGKGKKTLAAEAAAIAAAAAANKDSIDMETGLEGPASSGSNTLSPAPDSPMHGSKLGIATPPQPFSQSQPTPSVITRMLQSQPGQANFSGGGAKYFTGPPGDSQLGPPTTQAPYLPGATGPRGPMPGAYQQPPPGMSHYPVVRSGPAPPHRLHSPGPPGLPPMYHAHRSMDPSPSGGGPINVPATNRDRHSPAVVPPSSSSPLSKGDPTPPPPPYTRPPVGHFPPVTGSSASLAPTGPRHVSMVPPHLQQHRASNMSPYHPGVPSNYHYGSYPPPPPLNTDEGQPPPVYPSSTYQESYTAEGGANVQPSENSGNKSFDDETGGEFVGLVSYFSSQREDDLET